MEFLVFQLEWMMIIIIEYGQNLVKLLYSDSFVAIKTLLCYDCFNTDSEWLDPTAFTVLE